MSPRRELRIRGLMTRLGFSQADVQDEVERCGAHGVTPLFDEPEDEERLRRKRGAAVSATERQRRGWEV